MKVCGTFSIPRSDPNAHLNIEMSEFIEALRSHGPKVFNPVIGVPAYAQTNQAKEKESSIVFQQCD
jgi:hypothetical protein